MPKKFDWVGACFIVYFGVQAALILMCLAYLAVKIPAIRADYLKAKADYLKME